MPCVPRDPWMWALAGAFYTAAVGLGWAYYHSLPAAAPYQIISSQESFPEPGVWRITRVGRYATKCGTVVIGRQFVGDGEVWTQEPLHATVQDVAPNGEPRGKPISIDEVRYVLDSPKAGDTRIVTFDYVVTHPVREGTYRITSLAFNCENGFSGDLPPQDVQFRWPADMVAK